MPTGVYKRTEEHRRKIGEKSKGHVVSAATREKLRLGNLGWKHTDEAKAKMRGRIRTQAHRDALSASLKGRDTWNKGLTKDNSEGMASTSCKLKGRKHSIQHINKAKHPIGWKHSVTTIAKIKANRPNQSGRNNPSWCGGLSFLPYSPEFKSDLKNRIRERDNYTCRICGIKENGRKHSIHHIDYNKQNYGDGNLLTVCIRCNSKVNANRSYWHRKLSAMVLDGNIHYETQGKLL